MSDAFAAAAAAIDAARESAASEAKGMIAGELAALQSRFKRHRFGFFQGMGSHFVTIAPAFQGEENLNPDFWGTDRFRGAQRFQPATDLVSAVLRICALADKLETEFHAQIGDVMPGDVPEQPAAGSDIAAAVAALALTVRAEFVPFSRSRNANPKARASDMTLNWRVTLERAGRDVLTTDYSAGAAHCPSYRDKCHGAPHVMTVMRDDAVRAECETGRAHTGPQYGSLSPKGKTIEPKSHDVLYSLVMDSSVLDYARFEDWAAEYGYDPDSRSAEKTYRACLEIALALRNAIGEAGLESLRVAFQDY